MSEPVVEDGEIRVCSECQQSYQAKYYVTKVKAIESDRGSVVFPEKKLRFLQGDGLCPDCALHRVQEYEKEKEAERMAAVMRDRRFRRQNSGIPERFMNEDFSTFKRGASKEADQAYRDCLNYAEDFPLNGRPRGYRSLYLYGANGTGKTHLSCSIIHRILDRWTGRDDNGNERPTPLVLWVREPDLYLKIRASYGYSSRDREEGRPDEEEILSRLTRVDLLVLDDVGKEIPGDPAFVRRTLFRIIDGRWNSRLPMVVTANKDERGLREYLSNPGDTASFDRLFDMVQGKLTYTGEGKSFRKSRWE